MTCNLINGLGEKDVPNINLTEMINSLLYKLLGGKKFLFQRIDVLVCAFERKYKL